MRAVLTRLEQANQLDRVGDQIQRGIWSALPRRWMRDLLHGVWLGHPLHPVLVQVPVGAWTASAILDLLPGQRRAATTLVAVGTIGAVPAAIAGWNDWASLSQAQRRVGLVHAIANGIGVALYGASLGTRLSGMHGIGRILGWAGLSAASGGAFLGGHLAYKMGAGVNQAVPELHRLDEGWHPVADLGALPEASLVTRKVNDVPVLIYRDGDRVTAMLEHCGHQGGPLGEGDVTKVDGLVCVVCPWHGSTFRLDNGEVVHGPSATDQQTLPTRVMGGVLEIRLP
ncbi:Rieske 2Fe-2S domain-containing protein [Micromonospora sp. NPDC050417]|uniref:Rieske 2Fe-2S domain-containing protein n=1 Tax=Micromonospora sp. NPDC050417 TaxID=3364280 RepID=UPI0037934155